MKINWKWIGFVVATTMAAAVIFSSPIFRKYSLRFGVWLGVTPTISGVIQGFVFLAIFAFLCCLASSLYGRLYRFHNKPVDKKDLVGKGGGFYK